MNGKQAKLLRKMKRDDKASKREFGKMSANARGDMRARVTAYLAFEKLVNAAGNDTDSASNELPVYDDETNGGSV